MVDAPTVKERVSVERRRRSGLLMFILPVGFVMGSASCNCEWQIRLEFAIALRWRSHRGAFGSVRI